MSDSSVLSSADSADTSGGVAPDVDAKVPAVDAQSSTKAKKARKGAKAKTKASAKSKCKPGSASEPAVAPAALRKSASWCLAQLDAAVRASVNAALGRTQIESISIRGYWVLEVIADGGDMAQTELSALLGMDRSDMVRLIDSLESANLVERTRDSKDRRRQLIALTETGNTTRASLRRSLRRAERAAVAECAPEVRALLASLADDSAASPETDAGTPPSDNAGAKNPETATPEVTATETDTKDMAENKTQATSSSDAPRPKRKKSKKKKRKKKNKKGSSK
ncbi:MarR family transcriptional regulator [Corynebacterium amycolatum]|uniref:MarR family winged helix-turn-helix transcriptional regulator n=1 Tax=Corynebacterium amycolatum TaxID=43765 RepID=UPI0009760E92|nr:MarR family winged helix-turn-helix transcriptional regulator [Corynebacterium amycolatum]MDK7315793.1 MarR family winged helix-turn-helix transcriptional regulator [Corynebacterium amycolatum]OMQ08027.1 MarR family transcriptional regulator [Corynebacterium amycolatum]PKZ20856.1 MarR family transcriptional regulator [Corynebacterium amycolatum]